MVQKGEPAYVMVAEGWAAIVTFAVVLNAGHPPAAATV
jgi:hypothetical protein